MQISLLIQTRFHWRKRYYELWTWYDILAGSNGLKKNLYLCTSTNTCVLLWCFYQLFGLSFWRHPFTAEHPLLRHWCNATFLQMWWRIKLIFILDGLKGCKSRANCNFCVNLTHFSATEDSCTIYRPTK